MHKIVPHLWFDTEAREAAAFYVGLFSNAKITRTHVVRDTPSGDVEAVDFELEGQPFSAISAGPGFRLNPSISLFVTCGSADEVEVLWQALIQNGTALMELQEYPFSKRFGWLQDRFGVSWQLALSEGSQPTEKIVPYLLFSGPAKGKAADAMRFYTDVFNAFVQKGRPVDDAQEEQITISGEGLYRFRLLNQHFLALDHGFDADFTFNEAFSLIVTCDTQKEIDYFWNHLSKVPEAEACGWLKDRFGVSWQIVPRQMGEWMETGTEAQLKRLTEAFLQMKKLDIEAMRKAFLGV